MAVHAEAAEAQESSADRSQRQKWLSALACGSSHALARAIAELEPLPPYQLLRSPETGMIMLRGRAGGTGRRFNLGEVTMTRCSVEIEGGVIGHGYVLGRDVRHAEHMAVLDALLQGSDRQEELWTLVIEPLLRARRSDRASKERKTAATKVEFFTMVRGEG